MNFGLSQKTSDSFQPQKHSNQLDHQLFSQTQSQSILTHASTQPYSRFSQYCSQKNDDNDDYIIDSVLSLHQDDIENRPVNTIVARKPPTSLTLAKEKTTECQNKHDLESEDDDTDFDEFSEAETQVDSKSTLHQPSETINSTINSLSDCVAIDLRETLITRRATTTSASQGVPQATTAQLAQLQGGVLYDDSQIDIIAANIDELHIQHAASKKGEDVFHFTEKLVKMKEKSNRQQLRRPQGRTISDDIHEKAKNDEHLAYKLAFGRSPPKRHAMYRLILPHEDLDWQVKYFHDIDADEYFASAGFQLYSDVESSDSDEYIPPGVGKRSRAKSKATSALTNEGGGDHHSQGRRRKPRYKINEKRSVKRSFENEVQLASDFTMQYADALGLPELADVAKNAKNNTTHKRRRRDERNALEVKPKQPRKKRKTANLLTTMNQDGSNDTTMQQRPKPTQRKSKAKPSNDENERAPKKRTKAPGGTSKRRGVNLLQTVDAQSQAQDHVAKAHGEDENHVSNGVNLIASQSICVNNNASAHGDATDQEIAPAHHDEAAPAEDTCDQQMEVVYYDEDGNIINIDDLDDDEFIVEVIEEHEE